MEEYKLLAFLYLFVKVNGMPTPPPKSVNLAVETSFLFEPEDVKHNATILNNVRQFLNKLEKMLNPEENKAIFRTDTIDNDGANKKGNVKGNMLTKFLAELGGMIINYSDDEIKSLAMTLNDEINRNYVSNPKFHEMFENTPMKIFIKNTVKEWTKTDPLKLKVEIAKYIISDEGSTFVTFFQNLNQFFENDKAKFKKLLQKFAKARKTQQFDKPLEKIFELVFERYDVLDDNSMKILKEEFEKLSKHVSIDYKDRLVNQDDIKTVDSKTESGKNVDNSNENININLKENVQVSVRTHNEPAKQ